MKHDDVLSKPFFATLLEAQKPNSDQQSYVVTKPIFDQAQTQKWPSDGDDDIPPVEF
jgi:hypothetical protein